MKTIVSYLLVFTFLVLRTTAQVPVVTYVTKVALGVESKLYVDTLVSDELMQVISEKIRIALAPRNTLTVSERYLIVSNAGHSNRHAEMLYSVFIDSNAKSAWKKLPAQLSSPSYFPFNCLLVDTSLQPGSKLTLQFRLASAPEIIQQCAFERKEITPEIQQYRQKSGNDRTTDSILANALKQTGIMQNGFAKPVGSTIEMKAGNRLELLLKTRSLNNDSSIHFRLCGTAKPADTTWKKSGHLLTLTNLPANDSFFLEMKYDGLSSIKKYKIKVAPFWFQRTWATAMFVLGGVLLFIVTPFQVRKTRLRNEKEKRQRDEEQLRNAQSQLNPHFIFNALNSIDALVHAGENEKATEYLAHFSDMMRNTLRNGDIVFTSLTEDIAMLEKYIRIEQLRFDFRYSIDVDPSLDTDAIEFPPMLLQPAVENAVKHGVSGMGNTGLLSIQLLRGGNDLLVTIKDNGNKKHLPKTKGTGHGILFTKERISSLHKLYKYEIGYETEYLPDNTRVRFHFKNWL